MKAGELFAEAPKIYFLQMFDTWGFVDLLNRVRGVLQLNFPSYNLGTTWYKA